MFKARTQYQESFRQETKNIHNIWYTETATKTESLVGKKQKQYQVWSKYEAILDVETNGVVSAVLQMQCWLNICIDLTALEAHVAILRADRIVKNIC